MEPEVLDEDKAAADGATDISKPRERFGESPREYYREGFTDGLRFARENVSAELREKRAAIETTLVLLRHVRGSIQADENYAGLFVEEWDFLIAALAQEGGK